MSVQLIPIIAGTQPAIPIQRPVILVGRHVECDVRIDVPSISRRHCFIAVAYDRTIIRDLGSRNGVRVNGQLIDECRLEPGDEVAIAHFIYRYEAPRAAPQGVKPKPLSVGLPTLPGPVSPIPNFDDDLIEFEE